MFYISVLELSARILFKRVRLHSFQHIIVLIRRAEHFRVSPMLVFGEQSLIISGKISFLRGKFRNERSKSMNLKVILFNDTSGCRRKMNMLMV